MAFNHRTWPTSPLSKRLVCDLLRLVDLGNIARGLERVSAALFRRKRLEVLSVVLVSLLLVSANTT